VGFSDGLIEKSFSAGRIFNEGEFQTEIGGLVGLNRGQIVNSYSIAAVKCTHTNSMEASGLVGQNGDEYRGTITSSYSIGKVHTTGEYTGGFVGTSQTARWITSSYWDLDTSGQSRGCGNGNCSHLHSLTTTQFQSGLPAGFDPKIWGSNPEINNGYPYLLANPPR
jgi:hypothetical protein